MIDNKAPEAGGGMGQIVPWSLPDQPCPHLGFGLLPSRTERKLISVLLRQPVWPSVTAAPGTNPPPIPACSVSVLPGAPGHVFPVLPRLPPCVLDGSLHSSLSPAPEPPPPGSLPCLAPQARFGAPSAPRTARSLHRLEQAISTGSDSAPTLGDTWRYVEAFVVITSGTGPLLHAMVRGQRCC